jgi:hypothetical protein
VAVVDRLLKPAGVYFALVFGAGFLLGPVRVLALEPRVGKRAAEGIEAPVLLLAITLAGRWVARRRCEGFSSAARLGVGLTAAAGVLTADAAVGVGLRGMTVAAVFTERDVVSAAIYYGLIAVFAITPWLWGRR